MISKPITIVNKLGLHARAAAKFVTCANRYACEIQLERNGQRVNGKSIMGVMMLAAGRGTQLMLTAEGEDEGAAVEALGDLVDQRFGEDE
ncbi:MAG: HPr family phosphocarrier protein [Chromatiales bacterium]|jgi:phosphocarrier protein